MQLSMFDVLEPPAPVQPDYAFGLCDCGWLLCGLHIRVLDQDGWKRVRHLWALFPNGRGMA